MANISIISFGICESVWFAINSIGIVLFFHVNEIMYNIVRLGVTVVAQSNVVYKGK